MRIALFAACADLGHNQAVAISVCVVGQRFGSDAVAIHDAAVVLRDRAGVRRGDLDGQCGSVAATVAVAHGVGEVFSGAAAAQGFVVGVVSVDLVGVAASGADIQRAVFTGDRRAFGVLRHQRHGRFGGFSANTNAGDAQLVAVYIGVVAQHLAGSGQHRAGKGGIVASDGRVVDGRDMDGNRVSRRAGVFATVGGAAVVANLEFDGGVVFTAGVLGRHKGQFAGSQVSSANFKASGNLDGADGGTVVQQRAVSRQRGDFYRCQGVAVSVLEAEVYGAQHQGCVFTGGEAAIAGGRSIVDRQHGDGQRIGVDLFGAAGVATIRAGHGQRVAAVEERVRGVSQAPQGFVDLGLGTHKHQSATVVAGGCREAALGRRRRFR